MQRLTSLLILLSLLSFKGIASELPNKLVFAALPQYLEQHNAGQFDGNIVMQLGEQLGVEIELYSCPWVRCLKLIETGQADIIDDLFITKERAIYINYLNPAFDKQTTGFRYYSIHENISSFSDLNSFAHVDTQQRIKQQPYEVVIDTPLYLGVSRKSVWTAYSAELEKALLDILSAQL